MIDIFTPLKSLIQTGLGTHKTFSVFQSDQAYTMVLLKQNSIKIYNQNITNGCYVFDVKTEDSAKVSVLLGITVDN